MKNCTAIIVTFNRVNCLNNLIESIRKYYDMPIIIVDNGEGGKITGKGIKYYKVPFDSGLSYSRNFAVEKAKTKYILVLDDDFEFTKETKIEELIKLTDKFDIVGGDVAGLNYNGLLEQEDGVLRYIKGDRGEIEGYKLYDLVLNFFVATKELLEKYKWDEDLKIAEHTDFFLKARGLKITYNPNVKVTHKQERTKDYAKFRSRGKEYMQLFMEKNNIRKIINFVGEQTISKKRETRNITFCIKTFERKECLERLLFSIASYYPDAEILIADDSKKFDVDFYLDLYKRLKEEGLENKPTAHNLGYDKGISYGRNFLVDKTQTKYCLILDDDYKFTEKTNILSLKEILDKDEEIGVAGGLIMNEGIQELHFEHNFKLEDGTLYHIPDDSELRKVGNIKYTTPECIPNFFLMRKELGVKWDNEIKIRGEHTDWAFRMKGKWKMAYCRDVVINHIHFATPDYKVMRRRDEFLINMMIKNKFKKIIYLNGGGYELNNEELIKF